MSIASEVERIKSAKTAIKNAVNSKGGNLTDEQLDQYASAITALPSSSSMDFYKCAAVHGPEEVVCYEVSGCPDANYNGRYLPTGFETSGYEQTYIVYKHETNNVYYFYSDGYGEFGLGNDYEDGSFTYRGSVDSSWYDSDWMTVEGMSMTESTAIINTDVPKTWDGYKAVLSDGVYTFEETVTTGLKWSDIRPEIPHVYSADVKIKADWLDDGDKFSKGLIFHAPLTDRLDYAETGQMLENHGVQLTTLDGVKCARFDGSSYISIPKKFAARLSTGSSTPLTIIVNFRGDTNSSGNVLQTRSGSTVSEIYPIPGKSNWFFQLRSRTIGDYTATSFYEPNRWWTIVMTTHLDKKQSGVVIGKTLYATSSISSYDSFYNAMYIGTGDGKTSGAFAGYINEVRIYDRAFTYEEACEYVDRYGFTKPEAVFYAPLSESTTAAETGQALTVSGNVTYGTVDGVPCATFDGNSDITFPDAGMPTGTAGRTLSCWCKINSIETNSNPALFGYGARENGKFCGLFIESDLKVVFSGYNEQNHLYSPAGAVSVGKWYHVAAVKNGASEKLYINGVKVAEGTTGKNTELALGTIAYTTDTTVHKFNGSLAACRIYDGALSDSEIAELAGEFVPTGINYPVFYASLSEAKTTAETGQALTTSGNVTYSTVDGIPCAYFDGNATIYMPDNDENILRLPRGNTPGTISLWFKSTAAQYASIMNYCGENRTARGIWLNTNGNITLDDGGGNLSDTVGFCDDVNHFNGNWCHALITYNGTTLKLYIDGIEKSSVDYELNTGAIRFGIGAWAWGHITHYYTGYVAAVRLYDRVVTAGEIQQLAGEFDV